MSESYTDLEKVFSSASITHYNAARIFPKKIRRDVTILYAFVRMLDDIVDEIPDKNIALTEFDKFEKAYIDAKLGNISGNMVIDLYAKLENDYHIPGELIEAMFRSMKWDLESRKYTTIAELEKYMYGVASVVGIIMLRLFKVGPEADEYAKKLGYAAQLTNIIRDIGLDDSFGKIYLPLEDLEKFNLDSLEKDYILSSEETEQQFRKFFHYQAAQALKYIQEAVPGYKYLPRRLSAPVKTAMDMYEWTIRRLLNNPLEVYNQVLKPSKSLVLYKGIINLLFTPRPL